MMNMPTDPWLLRLRVARSAGFSLIELLVVITIIVILIALLMPVMSRAKDVSRAVACASNQRQIGIIMLVYAGDYKEAILPQNPWAPADQPMYDRQWLGLLYRSHYLPDKLITRCPADRWVAQGYRHQSYIFGPETASGGSPGNAETGMAGYAYNYYGLAQRYGDLWDYHPPGVLDYTAFPGFRLSDVRHPLETYWQADCADTLFGDVLYLYPDYDNDGNLYARHGQGMNMLWIDGRVTNLEGQTAVSHGPYRALYGAGDLDAWFDVQ